jgi:hypothetical protein
MGLGLVPSQRPRHCGEATCLAVAHTRQHASVGVDRRRLFNSDSSTIRGKLRPVEDVDLSHGQLPTLTVASEWDQMSIKNAADLAHGYAAHGGDAAENHCSNKAATVEGAWRATTDAATSSARARCAARLEPRTIRGAHRSLPVSGSTPT